MAENSAARAVASTGDRSVTSRIELYLPLVSQDALWPEHHQHRDEHSEQDETHGADLLLGERQEWVGGAGDGLTQQRIGGR